MKTSIPEQRRKNSRDKVIPHMRPRIALLIGCSAALSVSQPAIKVDVRQVIVPVVVTDKKSHHVTGLHASDFQVYDDGILQDIAAFATELTPLPADFATIAGLPPAASPSMADASQVPASPRRTYVICLDTLHSSFSSFIRTQQALEKLFSHDQGTDSQYVLVDLGRQLRVIQTATTDPSTILARLRSKAFAQAIMDTEATSLAAEIGTLKYRLEDLCRTKCACGPGRSSLAKNCLAEKERLKQSIDGQTERTAALTRNFLAELKRLIEEIGALPTRRTIILVSDGFTLSPGRELYGIVAAYFPQNSEFKQDPPEHMEPYLQEALNTASRRNVTIYTIDSRGVSNPAFSGGGASDAGMSSNSAANRGGGTLSDLDRHANSIAWENGSGMAHLAQATGGVYYHNNNDLLRGLYDALADGREYYVLAYVPKNSIPDGKFHRITVELSDKKLNVRAKSGYWADSRFP